MLSTIDRYFLKEVMLTFLATVLILLAMLLSNRLAGYLNQVANGLLSHDAILLLLGLQAIRFLVFLAPLALLLSIMLVLGRLNRDSEMVALMACGVGPGAIYRPLFLLALPLSLLITALSLYVVPLCMELLAELQYRARQDAEVSIFTPGTFRELANGQYVVYVGAVEERGKELRKIFVHNKASEGTVITTGERGYQQIDPQSGARYIVLTNGYRYEGTPEQGDYQNLRFQRLAVRVDTERPEQTWRRQEAIPSRELLQSTTPLHRAELHYRFSGPISSLVLTFLAPLLARARPREGRYGRVVAAVLIYSIYANLLEVGQSWLAHERTWQALGLWWIHGLFVLLGLGLWLFQYGVGLKPSNQSVDTRHDP